MDRDREDIHAAWYRRHHSTRQQNCPVALFYSGSYARVVSLGTNRRQYSGPFDSDRPALGSDWRRSVLRGWRSLRGNSTVLLVRGTTWTDPGGRFLSHHRSLG